VRCRVSHKKGATAVPTHCRPPEPVVSRAAFPARPPNVARDGDAAMQPRLIPNKGPEPVDVHVPGLGDEAAMSVEAVRSPPPITRASLRLYSHQLLKRLSRSSALPAKRTASFANWHRIAALPRTNQVAPAGNLVGMSPLSPDPAVRPGRAERRVRADFRPSSNFGTTLQRATPRATSRDRRGFATGSSQPMDADLRGPAQFQWASLLLTPPR
jgi:hypothetical protein